jgi:acetylornithine deacetylase/succinyl-diaminopimelate desuccinylase-like protein
MKNTESIEQHLNQILIPRPNGSDNLEQVADYLASQLAGHGAEVTEHLFSATPWGFQTIWAFAAVMMAIYAGCILSRKYLPALAIAIVVPTILFLEFEKMQRPVSGLLETEQRNIIGTWPGSKPEGPTLIFTAHYDTTTHFGDHFSWGPWGRLQGPATGIALSLAIAGLILTRKKKSIPLKVTLPLLPMALAPFFAMFWFQTVGPILREPSIGALDNGGSMTALLLLAQRLESRPEHFPSTVKIVFVSTEEERTQGSWAYAKTLDKKNTYVFNLEGVGASEDLAVFSEDGWATHRVYSSEAIVKFLNKASSKLYGSPMDSHRLPFGVLTDGRSFLAHGIDAITLRAFEETETMDKAFPTRLHSIHDSRERLSVTGIEKGAEFLHALVRQADIHGIGRN